MTPLDQQGRAADGSGGGAPGGRNPARRFQSAGVLIYRPAAYARLGTVRGQINRTRSRRRRYQEAECPLDSGGHSAAVLVDSYPVAGHYCAMLARSLPAETIEFSISYASEKRMPFVRCKPENRTFGVPAVADTDLVIG